MKIILLAAGKGSRFTTKNFFHKSLIKIKKKSLIENLIMGYKDLYKYIVVGHNRDIIKKKLKKYPNIKFLNNLKYNSTEMLYSLIFALRKISNNALVSYTDIIYDYVKIGNLIDKKENDNYICIPILMNWKSIWSKRLIDYKSDLETLKFDKNLFLKEIGNKVKSTSDVMGQYMGIIYIPNKKKKIFLNYYNHSKWKKKQITEFLNFLVERKIKIKCIKYYGPWYEFDKISELKNFRKQSFFKNFL